MLVKKVAVTENTQFLKNFCKKVPKGIDTNFAFGIILSQATSNKQQATSNKQQATSNKQQATNSVNYLCAKTKYISITQEMPHGFGVAYGAAFFSKKKLRSNFQIRVTYKNLGE